jgi:hypothetical protein
MAASADAGAAALLVVYWLSFRTRVPHLKRMRQVGSSCRANPPDVDQAVLQLCVSPVAAFADGERVNRRFLRLLFHNALATIAGSQPRFQRVQDPS